ncbi:MAG: phage integrase SAM-like domain-containing protein [Aquirufa sp.]
MASVTVVLKKNKALSNGDYPLYLRITKNRKSAFESLGISVSEALWDDTNKRVKNKYPNSARVNHTIARKIAEANDKVLELDGKSGGVKQIKKELSKKVTGSFIVYFQEYVDALLASGNAGTHKKCTSTLKKFNDYVGNRDVSFDEFNLEFLKSYEKYLRGKGNSTNTVHANLKVFRMLFNKAVDEDVIQAHQNPFLKFKLKWDKVEKIFLTEEELTNFSNVATELGTTIDKHKDLFIFACYAAGIRISDLLQLKWENFDGVSIKFFIYKTKSHLSIKLPSKALQILNKYKPADENRTGFIFPILRNEDDLSDPRDLLQRISSATAHANKNLKLLAQRAQITKNVTFHSSRHTFATRALSKGMAVTHASKLMGHSNLQVTMGYAKIVNKDLDDAMELFN